MTQATARLLPFYRIAQVNVTMPFELGSEARAGIGQWIDYYNADRPHSALGGRTPAEAHQGISGGTGLAA
jgi:transposase InsO family protein